MTRAEYAEHRGCSDRAVYKAQKRGDVVVDEASGRIDVAATDARWLKPGQRPSGAEPLALALPDTPPPPLEPSPGSPARRIPEDGPWLTVTEYANHRRARGWSGGTPAAVHEAIKSARISSVLRYHHRVGKRVRCIQAEVADLEWAANTRGEPEAPLGPGSDASEPSRPGPTARPARDQLDQLKIAKAQMEIDESAGLLIRRDALTAAMVEATVTCRRNVEALARDLAPRVATQSDVGACRAILQSALIEQLAHWSAGIESALPALR